MRRPLLLALPALALAACGSSTDSDADGPSAAGFPVTVDRCDREITTEVPPERIVSLNQGTTEILLSLGLADRMAGTATWTDPILESLADENAKVERLSDSSPSFETVLDAEPDLVTASFFNTLSEGGVATPEKFTDLGVPAYLSAMECAKAQVGNGDGTRDEPLAIDDLYTEIGDLAALTGTTDEGDALVAELTTRMTEATADVADVKGVSVAYWFANSEAPYIAGCCGGPGIVTRALGLENVFEDSKDEWPQIGWETIAERDPDVLVIGDLTRKSQTAESAKAKIEFLETNPVTRQMTAVKNRRYVLLAGAELNPSIRTVDAVEKVADGIRELGLAR